MHRTCTNRRTDGQVDSRLDSRLYVNVVQKQHWYHTYNFPHTKSFRPQSLYHTVVILPLTPFCGRRGIGKVEDDRGLVRQEWILARPLYWYQPRTQTLPLLLSSRDSCHIYVCCWSKLCLSSFCRNPNGWEVRTGAWEKAPKCLGLTAKPMVCLKRAQNGWHAESTPTCDYLYIIEIYQISLSSWYSNGSVAVFNW